MAGDPKIAQLSGAICHNLGSRAAHFFRSVNQSIFPSASAILQGAIHAPRAMVHGWHPAILLSFQKTNEIKPRCWLIVADGMIRDSYSV